MFAASLFAAGDATLQLTGFDSGTDADEFGPTALRITSDVTIRGPGGENGLTILRQASNPNDFRLFYVFNSTTPASAKFQLENLTLSGGRARGFTGGGGSAGMGGAIYNRLGAVTLTNTTLSANLALGGVGAAGAAFNFGGGGVAVGSSGGAAGGGGIGGFPNGGGAPGTSYDGGFGGGGSGNGTVGTGGFGGGNGAHRTGTTGSGNSGGGAGLGGAIFNQGGTVSIINSTLTLNVARGGSATAPALPGAGFGGGVFNLNGTLSVINSTIIGNGNGGAGGAEGGAVYNLSFAAQATGDFVGGPATPGTTAAVTIANSILAKTSGGSDVFNSGAAATIAAPGPNIVSVAVTNAGGATATGTPFTVADPTLGELQDNGGPNFTRAPAATSPAIDAGSNAAAAGLTTDERGIGFVRFSAGVVDIGAVEFQREPRRSAGLPTRGPQCSPRAPPATTAHRSHCRPCSGAPASSSAPRPPTWTGTGSRTPSS